MDINQLILVHVTSGVVEGKAERYKMLSERISGMVESYDTQQEKMNFLKHLLASSRKLISAR